LCSLKALPIRQPFLVLTWLKFLWPSQDCCGCGWSGLLRCGSQHSDVDRLQHPHTRRLESRASVSPGSAKPWGQALQRLLHWLCLQPTTLALFGVQRTQRGRHDRGLQRGHEDPAQAAPGASSDVPARPPAAYQRRGARAAAVQYAVLQALLPLLHFQPVCRPGP
jgi:hypothetical protein